MEQSVLITVAYSSVLNYNRKRHYNKTSRIAKSLRTSAYTSGLTARAFAVSKCTVDIKIYAPTNRKFDPLNYSETIKHLIDGLTDAHWWQDDDWKHLAKISISCGGITSQEKLKDTPNNCMLFEITAKEV